MKSYLLIAAFLACIGLMELPQAQASFQKLGDTNNQFSLELYNKLREKQKGNIFFSPLSISTALAMTYMGAAGDTKKQMAQALHFDALGDDVHQTYQKLNQVLYNEENMNYTLKSANRLYAQKSYKFLDAFLQNCKKHYGAGAEILDFAEAAEAARKTINDWVADQTEKKIEDLLPKGSLNINTVMVLVNAIYFKGLWELPFDVNKTKEADFHLSSTQKAKVEMMHLQNSFRVSRSQDLGARLLEMDYKGKNISMVFLLPTGDLDKGLADLESKLTTQRLTAALPGNNSPMMHKVAIPKFKIEGDFSLAENLKSLGMTDLFIRGKADLSEMDGTRLLFVSDVRHKSFLEVNEIGSEAAAATGVIVGVRGMVPPFKLDRPFLFLIREKVSGSILFMGRMTAPPVEAQQATTPIPFPSGSTPIKLAALLMVVATLLATLFTM